MWIKKLKQKIFFLWKFGPDTWVHIIHSKCCYYLSFTGRKPKHREIIKRAQGHTGSECLLGHRILPFIRIFRGKETYLGLLIHPEVESKMMPWELPILVTTLTPPNLGSSSSLFDHLLGQERSGKPLLQYKHLIQQVVSGQQTPSRGVIWACKLLIIWDLTNSIFMMFSRGRAGLEYDSVSKLFFTMNSQCKQNCRGMFEQNVFQPSQKSQKHPRATRPLGSELHQTHQLLREVP